MNRIAFFTGGHPLFYPTDLTFLQAAIKQALEGMNSIYGANFILSGVMPNSTGGTTSGYIVLNGEVMQVDAVAVAGAFTTPVWVPVESLDATIGQVVYGNGVSRDCHIIRNARLEEQASQPVRVLASAVKRPYSTDRLTMVSPYTTANTIGPSVTSHLNRVQISGTIFSSSNTSTLSEVWVATIPVGFRPVESKFFVCYGLVRNGTGRECWRARIDSDGKLWLLDIISGHPTFDANRDKICLDSIIYSV